MNEIEAGAAARIAFHQDDAEELRRILNAHPSLKSLLNDRNGNFSSPPVNNVRSIAMLDVVIDAGADLNAKSAWGPGGFGMLETVPLPVARHALHRGARLTVHGASRLGMLPELREMLAADPELVHARGGDGKFALHYAATPEVAEILLESGAAIDARDIDHESTAAQYAVKERQDVARYLVGRGCATDLLIAAALGDRLLADNILAANPDAIRTRVSSEWFPLSGENAVHGGTIYQWELGWHVSAVQVAEKFGQGELAAYLMDRCPPDEKFLNACWLGDRAAAEALVAGTPNLLSMFTTAARRHVAHAARNNDLGAVELLLTAGLPVDSRSQHGATPLHWAGFHGNDGMVRLLLPLSPKILEDTENEYRSSPLGWAIHGSQNGWHRDTGDYGSVVKLLLEAGAKPPGQAAGSEAVRAVLRARGIV